MNKIRSTPRPVGGGRGALARPTCIWTDRRGALRINGGCKRVNQFRISRWGYFTTVMCSRVPHMRWQGSSGWCALVTRIWQAVFVSERVTRCVTLFAGTLFLAHPTARSFWDPTTWKFIFCNCIITYVGYLRLLTYCCLKLYTGPQTVHSISDKRW
jgi:hypothetical protein